MDDNWHPIDTAPKDGTFILTWGRGQDASASDYDFMVVAWSTRDKEWYAPGHDGGFTGISHWMPLPRPPANVR